MTSAHRLTVVVALGSLASFGLAVDDNRKPPKPDLIVSEIYADGDDLVVEIQNQGPGAGPRDTTVKLIVSRGTNDKVVKTDAAVRVPIAPFATEQVRVPLKKLGDPFDPLGEIVTVVVDPDDAIAEEREGNNTCHRQIGPPSTTLRGEYHRTTELPDLVITDITVDVDRLVVHYVNVGKGATGGDFLIRIRVGTMEFDGNYYYRFVVPPRLELARSGGFDVNLVGLKPGDAAEVEATIDHEDRVRESDKTNNTFKKKVTIPVK
jgi:hypothetical protein